MTQKTTEDAEGGKGHATQARDDPAKTAKIEPAKTESQRPRDEPIPAIASVGRVSGRKFYYPSSCSETLEFDDLVYFTTEEEAQAAGFLPSRSARCP